MGLSELYNLLVIVGPTASGKTAVATRWASQNSGEIISGDSRQVYKGMDIGTGKDIREYNQDGVAIPYHLIDVVPAGSKYNVFEFQQDFFKAYNDIISREKTPLLCGGSGLYIEAVLKNYQLTQVPSNPELREKLKDKSIAELTEILSQYKKLHNSTDVETTIRAIRAIEIEDFQRNHALEIDTSNHLKPLVIGIDIDREIRREKITNRLKSRLDEGMVDEVQNLLNSGIAPDDLIYYGLEYKFITQYLIGQITFDEMFTQLNIAIHQFAKRQMTWFRGMEKRGMSIHWLQKTESNDDLIGQISSLWYNPI